MISTCTLLLLVPELLTAGLLAYTLGPGAPERFVRRSPVHFARVDGPKSLLTNTRGKLGSTFKVQAVVRPQQGYAPLAGIYRYVQFVFGGDGLGVVKSLLREIMPFGMRNDPGQDCGVIQVPKIQTSLCAFLLGVDIGLSMALVVAALSGELVPTGLLGWFHGYAMNLSHGPTAILGPVSNRKAMITPSDGSSSNIQARPPSVCSFN